MLTIIGNTINHTGLKMSDLKVIHDTIKESKFLENHEVADVLSLRRNYEDMNCFIELMAVYNLYVYTHSKLVTRKKLNNAYRSYKLLLNSAYGIKGRSSGKSNTISDVVINFLVIKRMDYIYNLLTGSRILL